MASRLLMLLLTVATPVAATSGKKILRNRVTAVCVVILVTVVLLLIMWKCISHLKKRDEMQTLQNTSSDCDAEISSPGVPRSLQVTWPGSKTQSPQQGLKIEAAGSFKTLVPIYQTTQHHILDDHNPNNHHHESLKSEEILLNNTK